MAACGLRSEKVMNSPKTLWPPPLPQTFSENLRYSMAVVNDGEKMGEYGAFLERSLAVKRRGKQYHVYLKR